jgi:Fe-S cluster assembly iron-binding protein IscA
MVRVTQAAVALLEEKRHEHEVPESHGVRIYDRHGCGERPQAQLAMTFLAAPKPGDEEVKAHGTRLYIATRIKRSLRGLVIDRHKQQPHKLRLRKPKTRAISGGRRGRE